MGYGACLLNKKTTAVSADIAEMKMKKDIRDIGKYFRYQKVHIQKLIDIPIEHNKTSSNSTSLKTGRKRIKIPGTKKINVGVQKIINTVTKRMITILGFKNIVK